MKINRTENAKRNIKFEVVQKVTMILLPFISRTIILKVLGAEYLGLNSIFNSVLQVLNLTELGFSSAIVYSMYKPIAEDNTEAVCSLLYLYKKIYRIIGAGVLCLGILIVPFLQWFIKGGVPNEINIYIVYAIYLLNTVISYWMFAYKSAIPNAHQRKDIISKACIISQSAQLLCQILCLLLAGNYYYYIIFMPAATILNNILISYYVKKYYPQYRCRGKVPKDTLEDIKIKVSGLLIQRICVATRNSLDSICISAFLGLTMTAMYNNYLYIVTALTNMCGMLNGSIVAGIGNKMVVEDAEANYQMMKKIDFIYMLLSGWCAVCMVCLYQPFMEIWVGTNLQFPFGIVVCFSLYFYVLCIGDVRYIFSSAAGLWWESRFRAVAESALNVLLNIVLVQYIGIYGIIIGTLISLLFVNQIYGSAIVFKHYFKNGEHINYLLAHLKYFLITLFVCVITYIVEAFVNLGAWGILLYRIVLSALIPPMLYLAIYRRTKEYKEAMEWLLEKIVFLKRFRSILLGGD